MEEKEEQFEGLSPLTILLIGSLCSIAIGRLLYRLVSSVQEKENNSNFRWKKRTREEEERIIASRVYEPIEEEDNNNDGDMEEEDKEEEVDQFSNMTIQQLKTFIEEHGSDYTDCLEISSLIERARSLQPVVVQEEDEEEDDSTTTTGGVNMTKKDLHKSEKKRKKQERQEAWKNMLEHERRLRELRQEEDRERERIETERWEAERSKKEKQQQPPQSKSDPTEDEICQFFSSFPSQFIPISEFRSKFSLTEKQTTKLTEKLLSKSSNLTFPFYEINQDKTMIRRIEKHDLIEFKEKIKKMGHMSHNEILTELFKPAS